MTTDALAQAVAASLPAPEARRSPFLIAIDGRCAAGKTTLAAALAGLLGAGIVHMDDFFLRPEQRTESRFAEAGGNVDRERFLEEVLLPLRAGQTVIYRPFNCHTLALAAPVTLASADIVVIEGSYSCHEALRPYYDRTVFLDLSPDAQRQRILARNGADGAQRFFDRWIPLEERYFAAQDVRAHCDLLLSAE